MGVHARHPPLPPPPATWVGVARLAIYGSVGSMVVAANLRTGGGTVTVGSEAPGCYFTGKASMDTEQHRQFNENNIAEF